MVESRPTQLPGCQFLVSETPETVPSLKSPPLAIGCTLGILQYDMSQELRRLVYISSARFRQRHKPDLVVGTTTHGVRFLAASSLCALYLYIKVVGVARAFHGAAKVGSQKIH